MRRALAFLALLSLPACGFSPVYGKKEAGSNEPNLRAALEATQFVSVENNRPAQLVSIAIEDALHPQGASGAAKQYILRIESPTIEEVPVSVETSQFVARTNLRVNVRMRLFRASDNQMIFTALLRRISSFNTSTTSDFSTVVARDDAIKRGATAIGADIAMRVQASLSRELAKPATQGEAPVEIKPFEVPVIPSALNH